MNNLSNSQPICKIKDLCHKLAKINLKSEYKVKLSLFKDEKAEEPCCSHTLDGESKCKIVKILAVISMTLLIVSMLENLFCCKKYR